MGGNLDRESVWYVLRLVQAIPLTQNAAQWMIRADQKAGLLAISAYLGAIRAAGLEYGSIVLYLLSHARYATVDNRPDTVYVKALMLK